MQTPVTVHTEAAGYTSVVAELAPGTPIEAIGAQVLNIDGRNWRRVSTTSGQQGWMRAESAVQTD